MFYNTKQTQRQERGKSLPLLAIVVTLSMCSSSYSQSVVIYENSNFGGRSKTLGIGDHRLSDFNEVASSIKVPAGLVAIIYEHAEVAGGHGIWVDFLEDRPDLTQFDFNDKASFVRVFATPNSQRFIWARNSMQNGQFIPGHWERARAAGNPANPNAVVAPPLPGRGPTGATAIQVNDAQFLITALGVQTRADAVMWETANTEGMGVIGSDYRGIEEIGSAAFERDSNNPVITGRINFWYPQKQPRDHRSIVYFKRTLSGIVDAENKPYIVDIDGTYEDHDMTLHIKPNPKYMYLIKDGHKPEQAKIQALKTLLAERENPYGDCDKPFKLVEAEIDTRLKPKTALNSLIRQRIGKQVSVYGPWVYDRGHCHQPEIHPAEQIWWSENIGAFKKYNLNIFCDSSKRFWWRAQMDDGTKLKPWGAPPIKGTYAIAFEVEIKPGKYFGKKFEVQNIEHHNVAFYPNSNKIYDLVYQGNALVSFVPNNDAFKVSYEKVGLKHGTTNIVRGFLVIETTVGVVTQIATKVSYNNGSVVYNIPLGTDPNDAAKVPQAIERMAFRKEDGYYMFTVYQTNMR
jgi:hypothetical protein